MQRFGRFVSRAALALSLLCGVVTASHAQSVILSLNNVEFADGGTASGEFSLNSYGNFDTADIFTTVGTSFPGWNYVVPGTIAPDLINSPTPYVDIYYEGYNTFLKLILADPLSASMSGVDPIVGGYETCSYGPCPDGLSPDSFRLITLTDDPELVVPEPPSLPWLLLGLVGLAAVRTIRTRNTGLPTPVA
jgi:hypothetical protein